MAGKSLDTQGRAIERGFLNFAGKSIQEWLQGDGIDCYSRKEIAAHANEETAAAGLIVGSVVGHIALNLGDRVEAYVLAGAWVVQIQNQVRWRQPGVVREGQV